MPEYDYSEFEEAPKVSGFAELDELVERQRDLQAKVEEAEEALRLVKAQLVDVSERLLPDKMDEMGLQEFKTTKGFKIKIQKTLRCSVAGDRKARAIEWLNEHGHGDIVKRTVGVPFTVGQEEKARELLEELRQRFGSANEDAKVEPATLKALLTQLMAEGVEVPLDVFGAFEQRVAKISV